MNQFASPRNTPVNPSLRQRRRGTGMSVDTQKVLVARTANPALFISPNFNEFSFISVVCLFPEPSDCCCLIQHLTFGSFKQYLNFC